MNVKEMLEEKEIEMQELRTKAKSIETREDKMTRFNTTLTDKFVKMFKSALTSDYSPLDEYDISVTTMGTNGYEVNMKLKLKLKPDIDLLNFVYNIDDGKKRDDIQHCIYNNLLLRVLINCHDVFPATMDVDGFSINYIESMNDIIGFSTKIVLKEKK